MSNKFEAVDCCLCSHPEMWSDASKCPGCLGGKKISHFKRAELYVRFPELARCDTDREMPAVRPEEHES